MDKWVWVASLVQVLSKETQVNLSHRCNLRQTRLRVASPYSWFWIIVTQALPRTKYAEVASQPLFLGMQQSHAVSPRLHRKPHQPHNRPSDLGQRFSWEAQWEIEHLAPGSCCLILQPTNQESIILECSATAALGTNWRALKFTAIALMLMVSLSSPSLPLGDGLGKVYSSSVVYIMEAFAILFTRHANPSSGNVTSYTPNWGFYSKAPLCFLLTVFLWHPFHFL